jgi:hypothetical protein
LNPAAANASEQEAAIRLYLSLGFHIYGTEQEAFSKAGDFYDEHLMTLELGSEDERNVQHSVRRERSG